MSSAPVSPAPNCIACEASGCEAIGPMMRIEGYIQLADPGTLYRCMRCGLYFRSPYLTEEELIAQYSAIPAATWTAEPGYRPDFELARQAVVDFVPQGEVLDIGCFRGDLLLGLPDRYRKLGIEPAETATALARERGIEILGASLRETEKLSLSLDAIIATDVIEHLLRPMELLHFAKRTLKPGGVLIVATGNADSWLWRRHRTGYWYNRPEHVAFFPRSWFDWAAKETGGEVVRERFFCHYRFGMKEYVQTAGVSLLVEGIRGLALNPVTGPVLSRVYPFSRVPHWQQPPLGWWTKDHQLVVIRLGQG